MICPIRYPVRHHWFVLAGGANHWLSQQPPSAGRVGLFPVPAAQSPRGRPGNSRRQTSSGAGRMSQLQSGSIKPGPVGLGVKVWPRQSERVFFFLRFRFPLDH